LGTATVDTNVSDSGNRLIDSLVWGSKWESFGESKTTITVGYGGSATGDEIDAIEDTLAIYEKYINVDFEFVGRASDSTADIRFFFVEGEEDLLGYAFPPGELSDEPTFNPGYSEVVISSNNYYSDGDDLKPGSIDFTTFVHEFGHAMGLAHPHDDGGTASDPSLLFPGVSQEFDDFGDYNLNQGVYTMMSYNSGWPKGSVEQTASGYGFEKGPMALDIMALQYIYGANTSYASGTSSYYLPTTNSGTTGYQCIWDTGGTDTIYNRNTSDTTIDLRAATGLVASGGGGYISYASGIRGGFTIAKGVTIENAVSSDGADRLTGNDARNSLSGGAGKDSIFGNNGSDVLRGGSSADLMYGGEGNDIILGGSGTDQMNGGIGNDRFLFSTLEDTNGVVSNADWINDFRAGYDKLDFSDIDAVSKQSGDQAYTLISSSARFTAEGQIKIVKSGGNTQILINSDSDSATDDMVILKGSINLTESDFIL
jgi:serralysin